VIELQYDTPLWGLQAPLIPQAPGFSIPFGNRSTLCDNERQFSKPRLRKASSRSLGSARSLSPLCRKVDTDNRTSTCVVVDCLSSSLLRVLDFTEYMTYDLFNPCGW
jgi:hypothetical protein